MEISARENLLETLEFNYYQPYGFSDPQRRLLNEMIDKVVQEENKKLKEDLTKKKAIIKELMLHLYEQDSDIEDK